MILECNGESRTFHRKTTYTDPAWDKKNSKNPGLCRTTLSISRPCLGRDAKYALWFYRNFKLFNKPFQSEKSCLMRLKPSYCVTTLELNKRPLSIKLKILKDGAY